MAGTVTPEAALDAALRHMAGRFDWRRANCCGGACAAFAELWGIDPMADLRPLITGSRAARRIVRTAGGLARLVADRAGRFGLVASAAPGALAVTDQGNLALSLGGGTWAAQGADGVVFLRADLTGWTCAR
jgi:hypothetical protein